VRLGAVYVTGLEHTFQSDNSVLFVELRALGQVCRAVEVPDREEVGPALGCASDDLGSEDFRESALSQRGPESLGQCRFDTEDRRAAIGPQRERATVDYEIGRQLVEM
jgi:hypothetical protein